MKNKFLFILFFIFSLGFFSAVVITDDLHLNIQTTDTSGNIVTGTFAFVFNISDTSDCSNIIYTNSTSLTTDLRGIISYYLPNVSLDYDQQYWLCYYRDGSLISNSKIARIPYAFRGRNVSLSGIEVDSNFNMSSYNFTTLGYVGIGTTSPARKFHIEDSGTVYMLINSTTSGSTNEAGIYLDRGDVANGYAQLHLRTNSVPLNKWDIGMYAGSGGLRFYDYSGTPDIRLFIENNTGNVGIGTTTPSSGLHISSPSYQDHILIDREGNGSYITQSAFSTLIEAYGSTNALDIFGGVMEIGTDGKVGIGTTNPSQKLDVLGAIQLSDNSGSNEAGVIRWTGTDFQGYNGSSWNTFATSGGGSLWGQSGDDIYYNNGYVGIGTTSPAVKLHVNGSGVIQQTISSSDDGVRLNLDTFTNKDANIYFQENGANRWVMQYDADGSQNLDSFFIYDSTSSKVRFLIENTTGNVGIGTATPNGKLDVHSTILPIASFRRLSDTDGTSNYLYLEHGATTSLAESIIGSILDRNGADGTHLTFHTAKPDTGTTTEKMRIQGDGKVGIGTTAPEQDLHIKDATANVVQILETDKVNGIARFELRNDAQQWDMRIRGDNVDEFALLDGTNSKFPFLVESNTPTNTLYLQATTGNVGIGTASPAATLDVNGELAIKREDSANTFKINNSKVNELLSLKLTSTSQRFGVFTGSTPTERLTILTDGKVGIGTASPDYRLTVKSSGGSNGIRLLASDNSAIINLNEAGPGYGYIDINDASAVNKVRLNAGGYSYFLGGNVGIGTADPKEKLHVSGGIRTDGALVWAGANATAMDFASGASRIISYGPNTETLGKMNFLLVTSAGAGAITPLSLANDGNVGIGVTDAHSKLEVNGSISSGYVIVTTDTHQDALDVSGANSVLCYPGTAAGNITIGGLANGVIGQIIHIIKVQSANNLIIEHNEGTGTQKILIEDSVDKTFNTWGGVTLVYDGAYWFVVSE